MPASTRQLARLMASNWFQMACIKFMACSKACRKGSYKLKTSKFHARMRKRIQPVTPQWWREKARIRLERLLCIDWANGRIDGMAPRSILEGKDRWMPLDRRENVSKSYWLMFLRQLIHLYFPTTLPLVVSTRRWGVQTLGKTWNVRNTQWDRK